MGTAAVLSIASTFKSPYRYYCESICMTSDGFPNNLECIARDVLLVARAQRCLTGFRNNPALRLSAILEGVIELSQWKNLLFIDDVKNACWISHSAIFVPRTGIIEHHAGLFEGVVKTVRI